MRLQLVEDARRRLAAAWSDQHAGRAAPAWVSRVLDPDTLTIGFARRVPTYKRLTLMLSDPERLKAILTNPERPVQFVIAGKSHPADDEGKRLIQQLVQFAQQPELRERIVFLPDYDMGMAELLYPGCDVWLNNPLRPLEACGTSGMKAAMNGALNLSILDGWWAEYAGDDYGWVIPSADAAGDAGERDALEAAALYDLLEHQVATRYYERDADGVPLEWVRRVRTTLATLAPELGADRMVKQYVEELYRPAAEQAARVEADADRGARELAAFGARVRASWPKVQVVHVESGGVESPARRRRAAPARLRRARRARARRRVGRGRLRPQPHRRDASRACAARRSSPIRRRPRMPRRARMARGCTPARSCSTGRGRSATRCGWCRGIRCSCRPPSWGWSPSPTDGGLAVATGR